MTVVAFARTGLDHASTPARQCAEREKPETQLRRYGIAMKLCFIGVLALWVALQAGCVLSLFLHLRSGIVVGTLDGTVTFRFWAPSDYLARPHAWSREFVPVALPANVAAGFAMILIVASVPFCAALTYLAQLFGAYSRGEVFTRTTAAVMRRIGHSFMATGYSPLFLGPVAHRIGVLRPITGVTSAMIAFVLMGLILLAISHVTSIGQQLQQDQEDII